jgi:2'-5' RNA ligase
MKRIFIAVEVIPGKEFDRIFSLLRKTFEIDRVKWVEKRNIHITLAFLGDTRADMINDINTMLVRKCAGSGNFELMIRGLGVFKNLNQPRIIWAGIEPSDKLTMLHRAIITGLDECGTRDVDRLFNPHLTLGRIKELKNTVMIRKFLEEFHEAEIQKVKVNEIILYESILLPSGPDYKPLSKITL